MPMQPVVIERAAMRVGVLPRYGARVVSLIDHLAEALANETATWLAPNAVANWIISVTLAGRQP